MRSRILIDMDFDRGVPCITLQIDRESDDVKDRLLRWWLERVGQGKVDLYWKIGGDVGMYSEKDITEKKEAMARQYAQEVSESADLHEMYGGAVRRAAE